MSNVNLYLDGIQKNRKYINQSLEYFMRETPNGVENLLDEIELLEEYILENEMLDHVVRFKKVREAVNQYLKD